MWRIGQLARRCGVSERTLRHYDKIGLLKPAAVDAVTGYRWYGVAELARLDRIRGMQALGLQLRDIADLIDAPDTQLRQAVAETARACRQDLARLEATLRRAEDHLRRQTAILPLRTRVGGRRLHVRHLHVSHPSELGTACSTPDSTLVTWLQQPSDSGFAAAVSIPAGGGARQPGGGQGASQARRGRRGRAGRLRLALLSAVLALVERASPGPALVSRGISRRAGTPGHPEA